MDDEEFKCNSCGKHYSLYQHHSCMSAQATYLPARGEAMVNSIESWQRLYGLAENAMKRDKEEISRLKRKVNKLEVKLCAK